MIDQALANGAEAPSPNTLSSIWNFGGAVAAVPEEATAFGDRSMPYMLSIDSIWDDPGSDNENISWTRRFWDEMQEHSQDGRMYLNFPGHGEDNERLVKQAFGAQFNRLTQVKAQYDPKNLFRFNPNIRPRG